MSNYDAPVSVKTPAPGETADISALEERLRGSEPGSGAGNT